jgi:predicted Zn-dependent peptidase
MKLKNLLLLLAAAMVTTNGFAQNKYQWKQATAAGYTYKYVTGDPTAARFYTLKNGLTVILSVNKKEPRITYEMAVRTGSNTDPKNHTGLAHYLEHLLFKGTDKFGTLDWAKEKPLLDSIDLLYEQYNNTTDANQRKTIYQEIDRVSGEAAKFAIANEYDKLMASIGSQGTNAHTSVEETVYDEDVPANGLEKLLSVQAERFRNPVLRIFHTELEAVYEEKNRGLDNDAWKVEEAANAAVFPTHNYGQQTTIGTIEHLKNPSLTAIRDYYYKYYVPNNMAIVLSGDFNADEVIKMIDTKFSFMKAKPVENYVGPIEKPIAGPIVNDIYGPSAESVRLSYRVAANNTRDALLASLTASILSNGKAGLLDLDLNKQQKVQGAGASVDQNKDYGVLNIFATPKQGQTLEDAQKLLLNELDILKAGNFDETLIKAIVANYKLSELQQLESSGSRARNLVDGFIKHKGLEWDKDVAGLDEMGKVSKKEIMEFAGRFFGDKNYVVTLKHKGADKNIVKVEKPPITPVETNAGKQSPFVKAFNEKPLPTLMPKWVNYTTDLQKAKAGTADVLYVANKDNSLFKLYYRFDMGTWNDKKLGLAMQYLQFIGTDKLSAEDISKQFYNLACNFTYSANTEETAIIISGLQENFDKAVALFENLIHNCKADETALTSLKNRIEKARANSKLNKGAIANAMRSYAFYGAQNPSNYVVNDDELRLLTANDLVTMLHNLPNYKHQILYYGPKPLPAFTASITKLHKLPATYLTPVKPVVFKRTMQEKNTVLFADYDMVQAEIYWARNLGAYNAKNEALVNAFNGYFGGGMGTVVFQTIRESKALAYSTYAFVQTPNKKDDQFAAIAYVGTQADKLTEAIPAMNELLTTLPENQTNFENDIKGLLKDIETERITKEGIIFNYLAAKKKGLTDDIRKTLYADYKTLKMKDLLNYHKQELSGKPYTYYIVASKKKVPLKKLATYGEVKELSLNELFGY